MIVTKGQAVELGRLRRRGRRPDHQGQAVVLRRLLALVLPRDAVELVLRPQRRLQRRRHATPAPTRRHHGLERHPAAPSATSPTSAPSSYIGKLTYLLNADNNITAVGDRHARPPRAARNVLGVSAATSGQRREHRPDRSGDYSAHSHSATSRTRTTCRSSTRRRSSTSASCFDATLGWHHRERRRAARLTAAASARPAGIVDLPRRSSTAATQRRTRCSDSVNDLERPAGRRATPRARAPPTRCSAR